MTEIQPTYDLWSCEGRIEVRKYLPGTQAEILVSFPSQQFVSALPDPNTVNTTYVAPCVYGAGKTYREAVVDGIQRMRSSNFRRSTLGAALKDSPGAIDRLEAALMSLEETVR